MTVDDSMRDPSNRDATDEPVGEHVVVIFDDSTDPDDLDRLYDVSFNTSDEGILEFVDTLPALLDWKAIVENFPDVMFSRVFVSLSRDDLRRLSHRANFLNVGELNPCLFPRIAAYYRFDLVRSTDDSGSDAQKLAEFIQGVSRSHAQVYVGGQIGQPPLWPTSSLHEGFFEAPSVGGIGISAIQHKYKGSSGRDTRFADVEQGWFYTHVDLPKITTPIPISGVNRPGDQFRLHGLMVLGLVIAKDDRKGLTGIAPKARPYLASEVRPNGSGGLMGNTANAIGAATNHLRRGDVILIEGQQRFSPQFTTQSVPVNLPVEADPVIFAAIQLATCCGIIVVEPTGNNYPNGLDLDTEILANGNPQVFTAGDSGAIVVAAGSNRRSGTTFSRRTTTNYSTRVNCFADGDWLWVLDQIGPITSPPLWYELIEGGGTSSAAAIIAGVALVLQSIARHNNGIISPAKMRRFLGDTTIGTHPAGGLSSHIGVMPNLLALETKHGSLANLHMLP